MDSFTVCHIQNVSAFLRLQLYCIPTKCTLSYNLEDKTLIFQAKTGSGEIKMVELVQRDMCMTSVS